MEFNAEGVLTTLYNYKEYLIGAAVGGGAVLLIMKMRGKGHGKS